MEVSLWEGDADFVLLEDVMDGENDLAPYAQPLVKIVRPEQQSEIQGALSKGVEQNQGLRFGFDVSIFHCLWDMPFTKAF